VRVPSHGDVTGEHRAIREAAAVVEETHGLVWVEGPDAVSFLDGILSQDLGSMSTGDVRRSLLLGPQGKLDALLWVLVGSERVGLVVDVDRTEHLAERLAYYRIRVKAEIRPEERSVWALWGPESHRIAGVVEGWSEDGRVVKAVFDARGLERVLVVSDDVDESVTRAGGLAATAARVEAGEPVMGRDVDESTIPQETGLTGSAVSFTKGCYLGQELVARIDSRGHVNRHLRGLAITRNVLCPEGSTVWAGEKEVGTITSVSESLFVGAPIGLSLLRREVEPGDEVTVTWEDEAVPAIVRELPFL